MTLPANQQLAKLVPQLAAAAAGIDYAGEDVYAVIERLIEIADPENHDGYRRAAGPRGARTDVRTVWTTT